MMSDALGRSDDWGGVTLTDRVIGTVLLIAVVINVIAARSSVFILPTFVAMALATAYYERESFRGFLRPVPSSIPLALFLVFAVLSAVWSADPSATFTFTILICLT